MIWWREAPSYLCRELSGETILVKFRGECFPLATSDGQSPSHFEVAGENREFHPAKAEIDGYSIRLHSDAVPNPVAARFAWDDDAEPNLIGECGLPVAPFRTDAWPKVWIRN